MSYSSEGFKGPKKTCAVCGLTFYKETELRKQDGVWKCIIGPHCYDQDENQQYGKNNSGR